MIVASNNKGKIEEIKAILNDYPIYSLKDKNIDIDVIEDAETFFGNALKKAQEVYRISGEAAIADDSGLCIHALNDFPGVMTHRFLGDSATDLDRNNYYINELNKYNDRSAKVVCVIVYYDGTNTLVGEGIIEGTISKEIRGEYGFGFDKVFELKNGKTLAELTPDEKNKVSARYLALEDLKQKLKDCQI